MKVYERAQDLWPALIEQAGLDVADRAWRGWGRDRELASYDGDLLIELRAKLFPSSGDSLKTLLKNVVPPLSAETLLRAFLQVIQPFAMMKVDILEMMAAARARKGDDNIKVRFQLNESDEPLDLLLNQFREQMEFIETRTTRLSTREWSLNALWKIPRVAEKNFPKDSKAHDLSPDNQRIAAWIEQSRSTRRFEMFPKVGSTGFAELDRRLQVITDLLQELLAAFIRYGGDYGTARDEMVRRSELGGRREDGPLDPAGFTLQQLYILESDYWFSTVGGWLLKVRVATDRTVSPAIVETIISELDGLIPSISHSVGEREEIVSELTDILNLPIWKKRHAVYAVWIGSQIWQALKQDWEFRFHLDKDVLSFAFSGIHLATLLGPAGEMLGWWTELRTQAANLPSGHRSRAIQPDYRIRRTPYSAADSDLLIVEVKQYKRSSTRNFSAALMDYAFACENAAIMLANYGPISPRVTETLPDRYRGRTNVMPLVRPDRKDVCQAFQDRIRRLVRSANAVDSDCIATASIGRAQLNWGPIPEDLDLHLFGDGTAGRNVHVYHADLQFEQSVRLVSDIKDGYGPEALLFHNAAGKHLLCVHQYSDDGDLTTSGAIVALFADADARRKVVSFECPTDGAGRWWLVCKLDFAAGVIDPINRLGDDAEVLAAVAALRSS